MIIESFFTVKTDDNDIVMKEFKNLGLKQNEFLMKYLDTSVVTQHFSISEHFHNATRS